MKEGKLTRRDFLRIAGATTAGALAVACTPVTPGSTEGEGAAQEEVVLNLWFESEGEDAAFDQEIVDTFNEMHAGRIRVEPRMIPDAEWFTALRIGVTGGSPPDVFTNEGGSQLRELIDADAVMPLDDWWEEHQDRWVEGAQSDNYFYGELYSITYQLPGVRDLLSWNVDLLEQYGVQPPTTWDEWIEGMEAIKAQGGVPFAMGNQRGWPGGHLWQTIHLRIAGAERQLAAMNREGVHWTEPDFMRASELYTELGTRELLSPGFAADDFAPGEAYFRGGNAAFFHPFSFNIQGWGEPSEEFNYGWDRFPQVPPMVSGDPMDGFVYGSGGYAISSKTEHPEEAKILLEYLLSDEVLKRRMEYTEFASAVKGITDEIAPRVQRIIDIVGNTADRIPYIVLHMDPAVGRQVFDIGALAVWTGDQTPQEWMTLMETTHADLTDTEAALNS